MLHKRKQPGWTLPDVGERVMTVFGDLSPWRGDERVKGIEPSYAAWEAAVLPLNYTRGKNFHCRLRIVH